MKRVYRTSRRSMKRKPDKKTPVRRRKSRPKRSKSKRSKSMRSSVTYRSVRRRKTKSMKSVSKGGLSFTKKKKGRKGGYPKEDPMDIMESINHTDTNESPEQIIERINKTYTKTRGEYITIASLTDNKGKRYTVVVDVYKITPQQLLEFVNKKYETNYTKIYHGHNSASWTDYTESYKTIGTSIGTSKSMLSMFRVE